MAKTKKNTETLSKKEKDILKKINDSIPTIIYDMERYNNKYIKEIELLIIDNFDKNLNLFLKKYDEKYFEILSYSNYTDILNNLNTYIEFENLFLAFDKYIDVDAEQCLKVCIQETSLAIDSTKKESLEETLNMIDNTNFIKHKKHLKEETINKFKAFDKFKNRNYDNIKKIIYAVKDILRFCLQDAIDFRKDNISNLNEYIKSLLDEKVVDITLYEANEGININLLDVNFISDKSIKVFIKENIEYTKNINDLKNSLNNLYVSNIARKENLNIKNKKILFDDGRKVVLDNNNFKIDSSSITDKSYTYKELNKMALDFGYKQDRCTGDHMIFVKDKADPIVIPQKILGKGLQLKILKDLKII